MAKENPLEFIEQFDTVVISSINLEQKPHTSYAPFVDEDGKYYVCISLMASHTKNFLKNPNASIMFIEDEIETKSSFARNRITFDVEVKNINREEPRFNEVMELFKDKFGAKADIYTQMSDFYLFEFTPYSGRAVFGFGKAYTFKDGEFSHIKRGM